MEQLIAKYTTSTSALAQTGAVTKEPAVILLTGSAGNLGSQILALLLKDDRVLKIYGFERSAGKSLAERHLNIFKQRGLDTLFLASPKLTLLEGQMDQRNLGLKPDLYEEIRTSVTLIIHGAWRLNFNMTLSSFEPYIMGTRCLIDLALSSPHRPRFLFTSSISTAQSWDATCRPCPEEILDDPSVAMRGYGQSKYVIEQILAKSDLNATSLRLGQICGAQPKGAWATSNWVPILVKTSITLGCLPLADGASIPNQKNHTVVDVAFTPLKTSERLPHVLNVVHPRPVSWNFVVNCIRDVLSKEKNGGKDLRLVGFHDWYKKLQVRVRFVPPGLKLLSFFGHLASSSVGSANAEFGGTSFSVDKIQALSPAVRGVRSITEEDVEAWVDYWHSSGFIAAESPQSHL
ncbi:male sterility protein-domain-containing protein [Mycena maculata]|uniref:Male sterility protein-domain-containing protein n=1 Tax=Mycena maculata TaxID=230809 RepID=A0AAD7J1F5_9AGAR|nr:male sterility protein-domain-containing protein [Mycena maculata]